jgi:antitoxin FitA
MATLTIRNVPDELVNRIKLLAGQKGVSMEQEIRDLLQSRYEQRGAVLERIRQRWATYRLKRLNPCRTGKRRGDPDGD